MSVTLTATNSLSIDQWAELMGIPVLEFNNLDISACNFDYDKEHCSQFWSHWQYSSNATISREQLSFFIQQAERQIENYLGYYVAPKYSLNEEHVVSKKLNKPLSDIKFQTNWKNVIAAGVPKQTQFGLAPVVYSDEDGDTYDELATVTLTDVGFADLNTSFPNKFKFYMPGFAGNPSYEITDYLTFDWDTIGNIITITFNSWLLLKPELYLNKGFAAKRAWNACDSELYVEDIEIVYDEVDTCLPNAEIIWTTTGEPCTTGNCDAVVTYACLRWVDKCQGIFNVLPVTVNEETGCIEGYNSAYICGNLVPSAIRINYISGCYDDRIANKQPYVPCQDLIRAILSLSVTYLGNAPCACTCIEDQIKYYNTDLAAGGVGMITYRYLPSALDNVFGSAKRGAVEAFHILEGTKGNKDLCHSMW